MRAWLEFFRLPNLPSAFCDPVVGICIVSLLYGEKPRVSSVLLAALAALALYMGGLADNDITGARTDQRQAPERPIPSGRISLTAARGARLAAFTCAFVIGALARFPATWFGLALLLLATILAYNRFNEKGSSTSIFLMGACRGLSVVSGAFAVRAPDWRLAAALAAPFLGTLLYIAALTALASDEHIAKRPLGFRRFLPPLFALTFGGAIFFMPEISCVSSTLLFLGVTVAVYLGLRAVWPLGREHSPEMRRRVIGQLIGATLCIHAAFALASLSVTLILTVALSLAVRWLIRALAPHLSGS